MRGGDIQHESRGGYVIPDEVVPLDHPLRKIREMANRALKEMSPFFDTLYVPFGRSSIPPEHLLRALLLQILYTIRSERQIMEQMRYNMLFRWFVGLGVDDRVWDVTVFTKNRDRLLDSDAAREFFEQVITQAGAANLLSEEHFTVDGTLIEAWASHKSFQKKQSGDDGDGGPPPTRVCDLGDGGKNPSVDFRGEQRTNETHASLTDPDARLARKNAGSASVLAHSGHALMENRNGLVVDILVIPPSGTAESAAATHMLMKLIEKRLASAKADEENGVTPKIKITLGADKAYDSAAFVAICKELGVDPHIARNTTRNGGSALDESIEEDPWYGVSQKKRKLVEQIFGWVKTIGTARKTKMRGTKLVGWMFTLNAAAYNLVRIRNLLAKPLLAAA